ncbi:MAG: zf-HC2 domain-containing protein [Tenuifilaceae bacterium]
MKMNCKLAQQNMLNYLDGTIDKSIINAFEEHVGSCSSCRDELQLLKPIYKQVEGDLGEYAPNPYFAAKVLAKLTEKREKPTTIFTQNGYILAVSLAAAAVAVGLFVGIQFVSSGSSLAQPEIATILANDYSNFSDSNPYNFEVEEVDTSLNK